MCDGKSDLPNLPDVIKENVKKAVEEFDEHTDHDECFDTFGPVTACKCSSDYCNVAATMTSHSQVLIIAALTSLLLY